MGDVLDLRPAQAAPRAAPANLEAEQAVLGILLHDNDRLHDLDGLGPEHFHEPPHGRLFGIIRDLISRSQLADPVTVGKRFLADPAADDLGGVRFLSDLVDFAPPTPGAGQYAREIIAASTRRELIRLGAEITAQAHDEAAAPLTTIHDAEAVLGALAGGAEPASWVSAGEVTTKALKLAQERKGTVGVSTGLSDLDEAIGGFRKGQMYIVAGRPSMGKSTAALVLAKAVARKGRGVLFFSMEMPDFDLGLRMASDVACDPMSPVYMGRSTNPSYFDASKGRLDQAQWNKLDEAAEEIGRWPLAFDVRPGLTVATMLAVARRKIRAWKRAGIEPGAVFVDHLTIARADQDRKGNKVAEVGDISRGLAEMAKTLDLPVIALCQLSRDVEKRDKDKRPMLSDLRWAGEIEQDARVVMFLYRPEYYCRPPEDDSDFDAKTEHRERLDKVRNKLFWLIEKNNNGPTAQVETWCDIACSAIRDKLGVTR